MPFLSSFDVVIKSVLDTKKKNKNKYPAILSLCSLAYRACSVSSNLLNFTYRTYLYQAKALQSQALPSLALPSIALPNLALPSLA